MFRLNTHIGNSNADKIIHSVEKYKADKGDYPTELDDLVPEYSPRSLFAPTEWLTTTIAIRIQRHLII